MRNPSMSLRLVFVLLLLIFTADCAPENSDNNTVEPPAEYVAEDNGWFDKPMRWAQLTLVENDPGRYDPEFWLQYFKDTHSDAVCLSAGGCVAYYPTDIPLHHRSAWMGDTDPFGELVVGCREQDMVVIARTDPHAVHQDVYDAHPDWIAVEADGNKRRHWSSPEMWVTCALGPYNFEFMTEVHKEIMSRYMVDGIFSNRWAGSGMCYCEHCQRNFRDYCGLELPRNRNSQNATYRNYLIWRQQRLFDLWTLWDTEIRKINPDARYIPNSGGGALSSLDMKTIGQKADILFADRQGRRGVAPPWVNGMRGKEFRATLGRKPIGGIFSVGLVDLYRWKDSVQSEAEIRLYVADGIANGLRPWFTKFSGYLYDRRWLDVVKDIYTWHYQNESYLRNEKTLARIAMVYSQQSATFYGGSKTQDPAMGMYHAMIEARIPFEMVHDGLLDAENVDQYKTLILPNIAALSDEQCQQISEYVQRGGSIVATYETSLYNEWGERRANFGLADLFGVSLDGPVEGPMKNSYLKIEQNPNTGKYHPLVAGLEDAGRIVNGVHRLPVKPAAEFLDKPVTLIPAYPDLPMEKVYPRQEQTNIAEVYLREIGSGRIVYFPWDIGRTFWETMAVDHGVLLRNAVEWATNESSPVIVEGSGVLDVTVWRQRKSMTVHLVNLTNPMMMVGPIRELLPIGEQRLRIRLPQDVIPRQVHLLRSGAQVNYTVSGEYMSVTVPSILDFEVVGIDF
jgi:hypothetical protein